MRTEEAVLQQFQQNPYTSTRAVARRLNTTRDIVLRVLHREGMHPFKLQKVQELSPHDVRLRRQFAQCFCRQTLGNHAFPTCVLFMDDALFTREGIFNSHNSQC
ncbi:hypothetical protein PR048_026630 [Dryococelus australis]|uniref:Transposase Tc1-like domain-containing protein n=1 Tax=Dryococelus australis TaxID=614101 RepID=A0ABQ9GLX3_9NEOP|nr:hypothetical protein PR048_026630 [Dryococelus australis]